MRFHLRIARGSVGIPRSRRSAQRVVRPTYMYRYRICDPSACRRRSDQDTSSATISAQHCAMCSEGGSCACIGIEHGIRMSPMTTQNHLWAACAVGREECADIEEVKNPVLGEVRSRISSTIRAEKNRNIKEVEHAVSGHICGAVHNREVPR